MNLAVLALLVSGCTSAAGGFTEFVACPTGAIDCGHVFMCEQAADNELGHVEVCVDDGQLGAAERVYGACVPTPRHQGLCSYQCPSAKGCNSYGDGTPGSSCFCPESP